MSAPTRCARCGAPISAKALDGLCIACVGRGLLLPVTPPCDLSDAEPVGGMDLEPDGRVGGYRLIRPVGEGGFGVVYLAEQLEPVKRLVALKIIKLGMDTRQVIARFEAERQALALMDHPGIARVFDAGATETGRPYFVMEFVEGVPITQHADEKRLAIAKRLELFIKVCDAVQHAHQKGVIHRDLKPSNILVAAQQGQATPKIIDFGLVKATHAELTEKTVVTQFQQLIGTPAYMSPEQVGWGAVDVDTRTDIYSLGVLLYELLTGWTPFDARELARGGIVEAARRIREQDPPRPSARLRSANPAELAEVARRRQVSPEKMPRQLHGDLDCIVMKALEKNRMRRYGSAEALAEDMGRWLRREPILARPIGAIGQLTKWTRRNPRTAMLVLVSSLLVIAFFVGQTISSLRLSRANTKVRAANASLSQSLYEMRWRQADDAVRADKRSEAIAQFSHFLRENPNDATAAARLVSVLSSCNFPVLLFPPLVHETPVVALDFNRAGDRLATASSGGTARLWNAKSGKLEIELAHPAPLKDCLLCGENDQRLLTISSEPKARLWDLGSRRLLSELELGLGPLNDARTRTTRDHRRVAINVRSNVLEILDTESGVWLQPGPILPTEISRFAMSPDGQLLAVSWASELRLYKFGSEQPLFPRVELASPLQDIRFSDDGRWLACSCLTKVWLMNTSTGLKEPEFAADAFRIAFLGRTERLITMTGDPAGPIGLFDPHTGRNCGSPFGQPDFDAQWHGALLFSSRDLPTYYPSTVWLLDPATGHPQTEPFIHDGPISVARLRADGRVVATASQDRTVRLWSAEMRQAEPLALTFGRTVWEAQWSPSGERIMCTCLAGKRTELRFSNGRTGAADAPTAELDGNVAYFAQWSPDGGRVAATAETSAAIWNAHDGRPLSPPLRHDGKELLHCAFSPDGELLATSGADHTVRLWDGHTGKPINLPLLHSDNPLKISFSSDGSRLATGCLDGTIRVWSVPEGKLVLGPLRHSGICWVAAFSPDNRWLVSASSDRTAQLWDARTGQPVLPPFRHESPVKWASFSPDGHAIATSTEFGTARVWDTASGQLLSEPMRHPDSVWYVKWSPDGRFLATTCIDHSARVWDAFTGHLVAQPFRHEAEVRRAEFSPDGRRLLTAGYGGAVKVWDLSFLRPPLPVPDWLPALAESLGGKRIGPKDSLESVPGDSFQIAKARTEQWGTNDYYGRWAHWFLQERFERPVKPFQP